MVVNYRIGSDLDGDGFINWGIAEGTPPNLFPGALYTSKSRMVGLQYETFDELAEDVTDISNQGFTKRKIKLGYDAQGDYAERIQFGINEYKIFQQHALDPDNIMGDSINGTYLPGVTQTNGPFFSISLWDENNPPPYFYKFNTLSTVGFSGGVARIGQNSGGAGYGFYDVAKEYSQQVSAVQAINGIPVTAGQTYTFMTTHLPQTFLSGTPEGWIRVYGDNGPAASPNFGRTYIAGLDFTWSSLAPQFLSVTFTVPVGVTQVMFDFQDHITNPSQASRMGGHMLVEGTYTHPGRIWTDAATYSREQFPIVYEAGKDYMVSFWVRSTDGIDGLIGKRIVAELNTANPTMTDDNVVVTSEWVRHDFYLPAEAYERGVSWEWTATKGGIATGLDNVGTIEFKGFMVTQGTLAYPYHAGDSYVYDDMTSYALRTATKSGKQGFHESIAYEGTMEIVLNNESKVFSPANTASPFYGVLDQNRKTVLQIWDGIEWRNMWSGWSTQIGLSVGENGDNRATLTCQQGLFRLREGTFSAPLSEQVTMDEVVRLLIESSGWRSTALPFQSTIGYDARVDENFYVLDTELMFGQIQEGVNVLELVGQDWGRKSDIEAALKELLASENASFWLDRDGRIVVVNRNYWMNTTEPIEIDIDSDVQESNYVYGQDITNRAEVIINRKRVQTDATVWKTHRAFKVIPQKNPTDRVEIEIHAERVEGRQKTIIEYTLEGMVKSVYTADPGMTYADPQSATQEQADKVVVELMPVGGGNLYRLRVINKNAVAVWVDIELKGDYLDTEDGTPIIVEDEEAINRQEAIHSQKISTGVLSDETQAQSLGLFYLLRDAQPKGEFVNLVMRDEALGVDVEKLFDMQIGTKLSLSESQTCETDSIHWIIGEDFQIENNVLTVTYTTARTIPGNFLAVGDPLLTSTVNLVEDWTNVRATGHNTVEYDGEKLVYTSISPNSPLYLDPAPGQIETLPLGYWADGTLQMADKIPTKATRYSDAGFIVGMSQPYYGRGTQVEGRILLQNSTRYRAQTYGHGRVKDWRDARVETNQARLGSYYGGYGLSIGGIYTPSVTTVTANGYNGGLNLGARYSKTDWLMPDRTDPAYVNEEGIMPFCYLEMESAGAAGSETLIYAPVTLIQMSKLKNGTTIDPTASHKYSLFAYMDGDYPDRNQMAVLTVYNGETGAVIGTHSQEITTTTQKWEVSIPSGVQVVWATFEQTPFIGSYSTNDPVTNLPLTVFYITGYGVTASSVASASDLHVAQDYPIIYP